ncbi:hypothetical protein AVEN_59598-1, partial [Araneus ventricosus]
MGIYTRLRLSLYARVSAHIHRLTHRAHKDAGLQCKKPMSIRETWRG